MPAHHAVICGACQHAAPSNGMAIHCRHDRLGVEKVRFEHGDQSREKTLEICRIFVQEPEEVNASGKDMSSPSEDDGPCWRVFEGCQLCGQRHTELHIEGIRLAVGHMEQGDLPLLGYIDHRTCLLLLAYFPRRRYKKSIWLWCRNKGPCWPCSHVPSP